jgi:hypothetical protein
VAFTCGVAANQGGGASAAWNPIALQILGDLQNRKTPVFARVAYSLLFVRDALLRLTLKSAKNYFWLSNSDSRIS